MLYFVRMEVHQPGSMSDQRLWEIWRREAEAVLKALDKGVVKGLWKVVGRRQVLGLFDLPDHTSLDRALADLPLMQEMGGSVSVEVVPVRPYAEFAADMPRGR
jgi:muconolactone delta-isomerase